MTRNFESGARFLPLFCVALYVSAGSVGAFSGGIWGGLGIGGALVLWLGFWLADGAMPVTQRDLTLFAVGALALLAAELPLSIDLPMSAKVWLQMATIFMPLSLLSSRRLQQGCVSPALIPASALAMICGAVFLWLELKCDGAFLHWKKPGASLTEYNRGMAHLVLAAFPVIAGLVLAQGRATAALLAMLLLLPASQTESHTAKLALIVGAAIVAMAACKPVWTRRLLATGSVLAMGWPFYARFAFHHFHDRVEALHHSFAHRVEIWDALSYRIAEHPWFGWGIGTIHELDYQSPDGPMFEHLKSPIPHGHNFAMSLWTECGLAGAVMGAAFLLFMLRKIAALDTRLQPYAYGCFAASVVVASFGFDLWTDSLWAAFALSAFLFGIMQQSLQGRENRSDVEIV